MISTPPLLRYIYQPAAADYFAMMPRRATMPPPPLFSLRRRLIATPAYDYFLLSRYAMRYCHADDMPRASAYSASVMSRVVAIDDFRWLSSDASFAPLFATLSHPPH